MIEEDRWTSSPSRSLRTPQQFSKWRFGFETYFKEHFGRVHNLYVYAFEPLCKVLSYFTYLIYSAILQPGPNPIAESSS